MKFFKTKLYLEIVGLYMLIDSFVFYNELDMLRFRLKELESVVDYFVLVESTKTFTGNDKPLFYDLNKSEFKRHNIIHIIVDDMNSLNAWDNEKHQRNSILRGLHKLNLRDNDIITICDVDEIPDIDRLRSIKKSGISNIMAFEQDVYYYNFTCKFNGNWYHSKIMSYGNLIEIGTPEEARFRLCPVLKKGGWHLSYFGDADFISNKISNFSHQEYNNDNFNNISNIKDKISQGIDLFNRESDGITYSKIEIKDNTYLPKNYKDLLR